MRYRDENKVQNIKARAIEMIATEGLENFGINRLAKAAGVSPATIYIYYKDKDDLITTIVKEETEKWIAHIFKGFSPDMSFEEGLWIQWKNRSEHAMTQRELNLFMEKIRNTAFGERFLHGISDEMKKHMGSFLQHAKDNNEVDDMPLEAYWAVAFGPLYTLIRFHQEGRSIGGRAFKMSDTIMRQTFDRVIRSLKKS
ncbi:TetR/AcrR family transcriptional regulator [Chitinophaga sp. sic0106]|uniref:TetR/AcrR family transcriptional regulator n=1 Tax=Chitinophaga sp. sic0106 TaxID=2854785 RepID=UPI001C490639|nr:TetR/AcrR family transcriptional regulator [Chitinophaga sp. sic0106]MBV7532559.1 TetR/AcrR family transcriptional regulator [Chitinophaga sp. sic0106]